MPNSRNGDVGSSATLDLEFVSNRFDGGRKNKLGQPESGWHEGEEDISNQHKQDPKRHALLPVWCRQRGPVVEEEEADGYWQDAKEANILPVGWC